MSSASTPVSIASTISAISSPALTPTIPAPRMRCVSGSTISFVMPSERPIASARPDAAHGNVPISNAIPCSFACVSVRPVHATSGSV